MICNVCKTTYGWDTWHELELVGSVDPEMCDGDDVAVEQRNCTCGSTLTATTECTLCAWMASGLPGSAPQCSPECECFCHDDDSSLDWCGCELCEGAGCTLCDGRGVRNFQAGAAH